MGSGFYFIHPFLRKLETNQMLNTNLDDIRQEILEIARQEIGVRELTNRNDGPRIEEYLAYTGLDSGHEWCAAFIS